MKEVFEAVEKTTESLKESYAVLQKKLEQTQELLDSVLDNTNSAIIAEDSKNGAFLKNKKAKELIAELGADKIQGILRAVSSPGVHDYDDEGKRYFRLSVSSLKSENSDGFIYVMDDITRLKRFEEEKQRNEKLRIMGEMAANIAHEVRNPLGSIELYASLLSRDLEQDADKKRLASSIIKGVRTINAVISNTLLFAKEIKINPSKHVLADIVDEVVLYLQHIIRDKKARVVNKLDENHIVYCDEDMYKQVVMNLIGNAVDAVGAGGEITATSEMTDKETVLHIRDNGCGIDKDMQSRLFMPFQTTKAKGTGLGLSIAYKIIKAHGGDISVHSDGESYTVFTVRMPIPCGEIDE
ncbi:MAG: two-component sensor histidine kinase [Mucispirillum sp.]|nr:two-component sensor histidine kinase [Mucispirillum sp.]